MSDYCPELNRSTTKNVIDGNRARVGYASFHDGPAHRSAQSIAVTRKADEEVSRKIAPISSLIDQKQFAEAAKITDKILIEFDDMSTRCELVRAIDYLNHNLGREAGAIISKAARAL